MHSPREESLRSSTSDAATRSIPFGRPWLNDDDRRAVGEVLVPAQTHVATANTAEWTGATTVFVDCDPATGNVTADAVNAAITPRTKAVAVVHFVGIPCEMGPILGVVREHGLK